MSFADLIIDMCRQEGLPLGKVDGGHHYINFTDKDSGSSLPVYLHPLDGHGGLPMIEAYTRLAAKVEGSSVTRMNFLLQSSSMFSAGKIAVVPTPDSSLLIYRFRMPLYQLDPPTLKAITSALATCSNQLESMMIGLD